MTESDIEGALAVILDERKSEWESHQLAEFAAAGKEPKKNWRSKYKEPAQPQVLDDDFFVPDGWVLTSLEALTSSVRVICYGILMPKENLPDGVLYVKVRDMRGDRINLDTLQRTSHEIAAKYERASLRYGDWLLAIRGTYGRVAEIPPELEGGNITQDSARIAVSPLVNSRFVAWQLRGPITQNYFKRVARGVAVKGVNIGDVRPTPIVMPCLPEQKRIVSKIEELFSDLDAGVSALERARANLRRYRASVLKSAVEGRLTQKWRSANPDVEPASELMSKIETPPRPSRYKTRSKDVIPGHAALSVGMTDDPLPKGWARTPLVEIAKMESGHTPSRKREDWWGGDIPWIGIADAREHNGRTIHDTLQKTNEEGLANSASRLLPVGTVCVSRTASVGYVTVMGTEMATSQDFVNWVPTDAVTTDWLRVVFSADREALRRFGKGSVHKTIYFPEWLSIHIAVPPIEEQREIVSLVDEQISVIESSEAAIDAGLSRAARLRQSILKWAFEGQLCESNGASR